MIKNILLISLLLLCKLANAQHQLIAKLTDSLSGESLAGATLGIAQSKLGGMANAEGIIVIKNIPQGKITLNASFIGYQPQVKHIEIPTKDTILIKLLALTKEIDEVVVSSTRSSRTISDIPTRVEYIDDEELGEKANMKPGDIRMLLSESTGIQTQVTSATSANAAIRIQGLDGRYTQILKDGFPLYSGAASGLGLLQIPPLDLKRVEFIKGAASTLYGGGAIAGLVNLISKTPEEEKEISLHLNATDAGGYDINAYYAQRFGKFGATIFAAHNANKAYDPSDIDISAIPKFNRFTLNPKVFYYPSKNTTVSLGLNSSFEDRIGGDIHYINGDRNDPEHPYFEKNDTKRISSQFSLLHHFDENHQLSLKNSFSYFKRKLSSPGYIFDGVQNSSFTELTYASNGELTEWIFGANLYTDNFEENPFAGQYVKDYQQTTAGAFAQSSTKINPWFSLEMGFRTDYVFDYGYAFLPRISALFKVNPKLTSRLGGGFGYKSPTIFTEESERLQYQNIAAIDKDVNKLEKSYGGNWDINYKTAIADRISFSINHLFFYTYISHPLLLQAQTNGSYQFNNIDGFIDTRGTETNVKLGYADFKLFLGYTYTDAHIHENGVTSDNLLTSKNRVNAVLFYEKEDAWKIGLEAYYFSKQKLSDGQEGKAYWLNGFMAEKIWEKFSLYINFENFLDTRQTRFDTIYTGSSVNPTFRDIYAPLDGFVINGGIKINL